LKAFPNIYSKKEKSASTFSQNGSNRITFNNINDLQRAISSIPETQKTASQILLQELGSMSFLESSNRLYRMALNTFKGNRKPF
jgi:hypothetical protein